MWGSQVAIGDFMLKGELTAPKQTVNFGFFCGGNRQTNLISVFFLLRETVAAEPTTPQALI